MSESRVTESFTGHAGAWKALPSVAALPQPGETYLRFRVLDVLGRGGMGVVLLAHDPALARNVAIKLVHTGTASNSALLLREAKAMGQLRHPNVVAVYEAGIDDAGRVYMVMEAGATSLRQVLEQRAMQWGEIVDLFVAAGNGLAGAHHNGFVHRDFKPDNVFVKENGDVCVGDFGLVSAELGSPSRALLESDVAQRRDLAFGTLSYMPPEQYRGLPVDARADQYAFCVALWEALYGELPFGGETRAQYRAEAASGTLRQPPGGSVVPRWVAAVLARGLAPRPEDRYSSMEELLAEFARDRFHRWPGWPCFASLLVIFVLLPLARLFWELSYGLLFVVEGIAVGATLFVGVVLPDLVMRSAFNWRGYRLILTGVLSLLTVLAGGKLLGMTAREVGSLNALMLAAVATVGAFTIDRRIAIMSVAYLLTFAGNGLWYPIGCVLLAVANGTLLLLACWVWVYRGRSDEQTRASSRPPVKAGGNIGRFRIIDVLRDAEDSTLLDVYDPRLKRRVTLQVGAIDLREARGLAALRHPNLMTVYQVGTHEGRSYVAYESVVGSTLRQSLADGGERSWRDTLGLFVEAGRGLAAGHRAGFVHASFSTDQVFLGEDGRVLLSGVGVHASGNGDAAELRAPELRAGGQANALSDQYAFCAALGAALASVPMGRVPAWVGEVLARGLRVRPEERYRSMDALLAKLAPADSKYAGSVRDQLFSLGSYMPLAVLPIAASGFNFVRTAPLSLLEQLVMALGSLFYVMAVNLVVTRSPACILRNRWTWHGMVIAMAGSVVLVLGAMALDLPPEMTEHMHLALWATVCASVAWSAEPRVLPAACGLLLAFFTSCLFPAATYMVTAAGVVFCVLNCSWLLKRDEAPAELQERRRLGRAPLPHG